MAAESENEGLVDEELAESESFQDIKQWEWAIQFERRFNNLENAQVHLESTIIAQAASIESFRQENDILKSDLEVLRATCSNLTVMCKMKNDENSSLKAQLTKFRADFDVHIHSTASENKSKILDRVQSKLSNLEKNITKEQCGKENWENSEFNNTVKGLHDLIKTKDEIITSTQQQLMNSNKLNEKLKIELLAYHINPQITTQDVLESPTTKHRSDTYAEMVGKNTNVPAPTETRREPKTAANPVQNTRSTVQNMASTQQRLNVTTDGNSTIIRTREQQGPKFDLDLLILGDSNVQKIAGEKMYRYKQVEVVSLPEQKKNIKGAIEFMKSYTKSPRVIILHIAGNTLYHSSAEETVFEMHNLIEQCMEKYPEAKVVQSEAIGRWCGSSRFTDIYCHKVNNFNRIMRDIMQDDSLLITHPSLNDPWSNMFIDDGIHLSRGGLLEFIRDMKFISNPHLGMVAYNSYGLEISGLKSPQGKSVRMWNDSERHRNFENREGANFNGTQNYRDFVTEFDQLRGGKFRR